MSAPFNDRGPFSVGEVVRVISSESCPWLIGVEVQITSELVWCGNQETGKIWLGHETNIEFFAPMEKQLRRRKPPTEFKGEQIMAQLIRDTLDKAPMREKEMV